MKYAIASIIGLGISWLLYRVFLKNEKSFRFNRVYLLGSLVLCLLAPALELDFGGSFSNLPKIEVEKAASQLFYEEIKGQTVQKLERQSTWPFQFLWFAYFAISGVLLFRFGRNFFGLLYRIKNNCSGQAGSLRIVPLKEKGHPYSFFRYLFIHEEDFQNKKYSEAIIKHETAHSKQLHSIDLVFLELLICFLWFNPFVWLYKKAVVENHEFLADADAVKNGIDIHAYSKQLVRAGNTHFNFPLISGFHFNLTKNRIVMLHKKRSLKSVTSLKMGVVLAIFAGLFVFFSCSKDAPSDPFVVVVDAGHGGRDPGTSNEKTINLQVATKLAVLSQGNQVEIILIRDKDEFINLSDRVEFIKNQNADMLLSLHCNGSNDTGKRGVVAYYARNGKSKAQSLQYSKVLVSNYLKEISEKGEIATVGFMILREVQIPGVMLELGYLSNETEARELQQPKFQEKIAENIYESLVQIAELQ